VIKEAYRTLRKGPRMWYRYIDDILGIWKGTKEEYKEFVVICEREEERIKITHQESEKEMTFLDVKIVVNEHKRLETKVNKKINSNNMYLHNNSDHQVHTKKGIIKSQLTRFRRICTKIEDHRKETKMIRGYNERDIEEKMKEIDKKGRESCFGGNKKEIDNK
jgi:hypothetical protein